MDHYRRLEKMYLSAPVNTEVYPGIGIHVENEKAEITLPVTSRYFHAAHAIHGSVYFKLLDDAAFFAVNSVVMDVFVYTVSYNIQLLRPVSEGIIKSVGQMVFKSTNLFVGDSTLYNAAGKVVGRGSGTFMRSKIALSPEIGY